MRRLLARSAPTSLLSPPSLSGTSGISVHLVISQATGNRGSIRSNDSYNNECQVRLGLQGLLQKTNNKSCPSSKSKVQVWFNLLLQYALSLLYLYNECRNNYNRISISM